MRDKQFAWCYDLPAFPFRASRSPTKHTSNSRFVTAKKMKRQVVEKTTRLLIAIAFSVPLASAQGRGFTIQVESAISEAEARSSVAKLIAQGLEAYWVKTTIPGIGVRYRVRIGRYQNQAQARAKAEQLLGAGVIKEFIVTVYDASPSDPQAPDESKPATSPPNGSERISDKSRPRDKNSIPEAKPGAKTESQASGAPGARPRRISSAASAGAPAPAEAAADMTIDNDNWKVVKHDVEIDKNLRAVHFVDAMTGWAAGDSGSVYVTTDGGRGWKPQSPGSDADINFIYFVDRNRGWMLGKSVAKAGDESGGDDILFITADGGGAWARKPLPNVTSLHFTDAKTGWAVGKNFTLLKTTDGGLEWSKVRSLEKLIGPRADSPNDSFGFSDVHFTDAKHGWLIGNFYGRERCDIGGVFTTSDGGATWKRVPLAIQTRNNSGLFTPGALDSAHFTDANTGSITGEMYDGERRYFFALHTRDGGRTWSLFRIPSRATHNSQFLDPARGWTAAFLPRASGDEAAVYDTTLLRTGNGGLSWRIDFVARGRRVRGVFFLSPTKGWAVGDGGIILSYEEKEKAN
jgi:photosystem II stability/assembly factor-like uncharacterized protein